MTVASDPIVRQVSPYRDELPLFVSLVVVAGRSKKAPHESLLDSGAEHYIVVAQKRNSVAGRVLGRALCLVGSGIAICSFLLLGFFLLSDGRTPFGASYRGDPEFQRYWLVYLALMAFGTALAWIGMRWLAEEK